MGRDGDNWNAGAGLFLFILLLCFYCNLYNFLFRNVAAVGAEQGGVTEDEGSAVLTQVLSYQKHVHSLKKIKPGIKI